MSGTDSKPSIGALFTGFLSIGLSGFGGVLPWVRRMVVEQRGWLGAEDFTEMLAFCQLLPGPNVGNMAVTLGARFHGWRGSVAAVAGLFACPLVIVVALGILYGRYEDVPWVRRMFAALAAAASGLVFANALKIAAPLRGNWIAILFALLAFVAIAWLRVPLPPVVLVLAPIAMAIAARRRG